MTDVQFFCRTAPENSLHSNVVTYNGQWNYTTLCTSLSEPISALMQTVISACYCAETVNCWLHLGWLVRRLSSKRPAEQNTRSLADDEATMHSTRDAKLRSTVQLKWYAESKSRYKPIRVWSQYCDKVFVILWYYNWFFIVVDLQRLIETRVSICNKNLWEFFSFPSRYFPFLPISISKLESYFHSHGFPMGIGNPIPIAISIGNYGDWTNYWKSCKKLAVWLMTARRGDSIESTQNFSCFSIA